MDQVLTLSVTIQASATTIWEALTIPSKMTQWMADPEVELKIFTDWVEGHDMLISGFHHGPFENRGKVLRVEPGRTLSYSHLSSLSRLPDEPENYTTLSFELNETPDEVEVTLGISNFPTTAIFHHLEFYWRSTLMILKAFCERQK